MASEMAGYQREAPQPATRLTRQSSSGLRRSLAEKQYAPPEGETQWEQSYASALRGLSDTYRAAKVAAVAMASLAEQQAASSKGAAATDAACPPPPYAPHIAREVDPDIQCAAAWQSIGEAKGKGERDGTRDACCGGEAGGAEVIEVGSAPYRERGAGHGMSRREALMRVASDRKGLQAQSCFRLGPTARLTHLFSLVTLGLLFASFLLMWAEFETTAGAAGPLHWEVKLYRFYARLEGGGMSHSNSMYYPFLDFNGLDLSSGIPCVITLLMGKTALCMVFLLLGAVRRLDPGFQTRRLVGKIAFVCALLVVPSWFVFAHWFRPDVAAIGSSRVPITRWRTTGHSAGLYCMCASLVTVFVTMLLTRRRRAPHHHDSDSDAYSDDGDGYLYGTLTSSV